MQFYLKLTKLGYVYVFIALPFYTTQIFLIDKLLDAFLKTKSYIRVSDIVVDVLVTG